MSSKHGKRPKSVFTKIMACLSVCKKSSIPQKRQISDPEPISLPNQNQIESSYIQQQPISLPLNNLAIEALSKNNIKMTKLIIRTKYAINSLQVSIISMKL